MRKIVVTSLVILASLVAFITKPTGAVGGYTVTDSFTYDPTQGTMGVLWWNKSFTGTSPQPMPNYIHTPSSTTSLNGDGSGIWTYGPGVPANSTMNWNHGWGFDLGTDCASQWLATGTCQGQDEDKIMCSSGATFLNIFHGMEAEDAITTFFVYANERGGNPQCSPQSSPPDWPGLFQSPDYSDVDRTYRARNVGIRICANPPCTGKPWIFPGPPRVYKQISNVQPPMHCTNKDNGFISDKNVTY